MQVEYSNITLCKYMRVHTHVLAQRNITVLLYTVLIMSLADLGYLEGGFCYTLAREACAKF